MATKTHLIKIGNSRGVRLPKALLQQCDLEDAVELEVQSGCVVIRPLRSTRWDWDRAFVDMARAGDDRLVDGDLGPSTAWDDDEWQW